MKKPVVRRAVDLLMTAALLLLMSYSLAVGEAVHEWTGMGMFLLFMFHLILNRKWLQSLSRGRYTARRAYSFCRLSGHHGAVHFLRRLCEPPAEARAKTGGELN